MVEWLGVGLVILFIIFMAGLFRMSWNIAKSGTDLMELLGGARGAGHTKNSISGEGAPRKKIENPKWGKDGKMK